jgi:hypothetical protein
LTSHGGDNSPHLSIFPQIPARPGIIGYKTEQTPKVHNRCKHRTTIATQHRKTQPQTIYMGWNNKATGFNITSHDQDGGSSM